jgi:hypothetical protein
MCAGSGLDADVLRAANINPVTGLATDYLNHYNEAAMLVAMLSDMPDMADMVLDWRPLDYPSHFRNTHFREKDLAIAAYAAAPADVLERFHTGCRQVEDAIGWVQRSIEAEPARAGDLAGEAQPIFDLIAAVGGVINGGAQLLAANDDQSAVDALFG